MTPGIYRLVILFVGATLVLSVIAIAILALVGNDQPDTLKQIPALAMTGLLGLIVTPKG